MNIVTNWVPSKRKKRILSLHNSCELTLTPMTSFGTDKKKKQFYSQYMVCSHCLLFRSFIFTHSIEWSHFVRFVMAVILFTQGIDVSKILRKNHVNNKWLFLEINKCAKMSNWCNRKHDHDFRRHDSKKYRGHSYPKNIASKNNLRFILLSSFVIRFMSSLL